MHDVETKTFQPNRADYGVLVLVAAVVYFGFGPRLSFPDRFGRLADAMVRGQWVIEVNGFPDELIPAGDGRYYVAYPPLPAALLIPMRAALGSDFGARAACRCACIVAIILFGATLPLCFRRGIGPCLSKLDWYLWGGGFAFGTAVWDSATWAGDWHYAHAVALGFFMAALREYVAGRRWWLIGLWMGLATLARPTVLFAGSVFIFAAPSALLGRKQLKTGAGFCFFPLCAIALLALYNAARFGNPFDFGYDQMALRGEGLELMNAYGQFDLVYLPRNLYWFFFAPPAMVAGGGFPYLSYDAHGLSLLLASPIFLLAGLAKWCCWRERIVWSALLASGICLIPLVLYFNTGFAQFGHRFSMDYLPLLLLLTLIGAAKVKQAIWRGLLIVSIVVHIWGLQVVGPQTQSKAWRPEFIEVNLNIEKPITE